MAIYRFPVELTWPGSGSPGVNVWHIRSGGATVTDPADDLATQAAVDAVHTFYNNISGNGAIGGALLAEAVSIKAGTMVDIESAEEFVPSWSTITSTATGGQGPAPIAVCISWRTSVAARRGRGRTFVGPLSTTWLETNGTPGETNRTKLGASAQALVDASLQTNNWAVGVWGQQSLMSGESVTAEMRRLAPHVFRDFTGYSVKDKFAVLRSRRD